MQSELRSLSKIFSEAIYRIPDYQRGYSWGEKHLKDFWMDLEQLPSGRSHYTGVLTLEPVSPDVYMAWHDDIWIIGAKRYSPIYVVDGQQRLTTAVVLLQAILDTIPDDAVLNYTTKAEIRKKYIFESKDNGISRSYIFGYEKDNPSYEFLKRSIYCEVSGEHSVLENTIYTYNLSFAKNFFLERLKPLSLVEVESLYTKLTQNLQFNIFNIEPELDVFVTFETMNNRGKPLSHLELLKNRLIYLSTRFPQDEDRATLRRRINESWKTVYHYLGKTASHLLSDDLFLRTHFLAYYGPDLPLMDEDDSGNVDYDIYRYMDRDELYKNYLLDEVYSARRINPADGKNALTISEVDHYTQDIKKAVELYYNICEPGESNFSDDEKIALDRLSRIGRGGIRLLALVSAQVEKDSVARAELLSSLEVMAFLSLLRPYAFRGVSLEQLAIKLKAGTLNSGEVRRIIINESKRFVESPDFAESIKNIGKGDGFYGWKGLRYFMYEYEQSLRARTKSDRVKLDWDQFNQEKFDSDYKTVEHIYPQKASDSYWRGTFSDYSVSERNILRNSIGNLLPVSHGKNSSLGNKSFQVKKGDSVRQVGYSYGCYSEVQVAQQKDWGALQILARGVSLLSFMEARWGFSIGDDSKKVELLGLSFVLSRCAVGIDKLRPAFDSGD